MSGAVGALTMEGDNRMVVELDLVGFLREDSIPVWQRNRPHREESFTERTISKTNCIHPGCLSQSAARAPHGWLCGYHQKFENPHAN